MSSTGTATHWTSISIVPYITNSVIDISTNTTKTFILQGYNFTPGSVVTIPGFDGTIDTVDVISPTEIHITVTSGVAETDYDIVVSNNGTENRTWTGNGNNLLHVSTKTLYLYAITDSTHSALSELL